ncbi:MAG: multifunctional CCA addition/repair protein [Herbaspirillum sp.]
MEIYTVGGAVRDGLLGLPVQDRDYVVVGATPEQMVTAGFRPVGKDFPVFLHPETHEEYALARTERKTALGYAGFAFHAAPDVTLEQDLVRRDLTINAMARAADGSLIDPFGGQRDLQARIFRHVSPAFGEDPVRILRLARFAARFDEFSLAPETLTLMRQMVSAGEVAALVSERVWQELARGLMEAKPSRMFAMLRECGALAVLLPELDALWGVPQPPQYHPEIDTGVHVMLALDLAAKREVSLSVRWAVLLHDLGKGATPPDEWPHHYGHEARGATLAAALCKRLKVPNDCRDLAQLGAREHGVVGRAFELRAATIVTLFERCDAFRKPERFADLLLVAECDARGRPGWQQREFAQPAYLLARLEAARAVDAGAIATAVLARYPAEPSRIAAAVHQARVAVVAAAASSQH